jgi:hypothetical protein
MACHRAPDQQKRHRVVLAVSRRHRKSRTLNPRVRGSSPWRRTLDQGSDLGKHLRSEPFSRPLWTLVCSWCAPEPLDTFVVLADRVGQRWTMALNVRSTSQSCRVCSPICLGRMAGEVRLSLALRVRSEVVPVEHRAYAIMSLSTVGVVKGRPCQMVDRRRNAMTAAPRQMCPASVNPTSLGGTSAATDEEAGRA